jgi:ABC-type sugar transport system ATPase subunit
MGLVSPARERARARDYIERLRISPPDPDRRTATLSGGTQQKVMLAKWLAIEPRVLILDEPTRGIDVSAKVEIYRLMDRFVSDGGAVLLISSDLPELLAMSDRMVVMHEGRTAGELGFDEFRQERALALATGLDNQSGAQYA